MEVKGSAVISTSMFVKNKFSERFNEWIDALSPTAKNILTEPILPNEWYPLYEGLTEPTKKVCDIFYNGDKKGAWELGRYSADMGLKRFYRIFLRFGSPHFMIKRASTIFSLYYNPSKMVGIKEGQKSGIMKIVEFPEPDELIEFRVCGWIERALELTNCKNPVVKIAKSLTRGDEYTEISVKWD